MEKWYYEVRDFSGTMGILEHTLDIAFTAGIDASGAVQIELERIHRVPANSFIVALWDEDHSRFPEFRLSGEASDGSRFETSSLIITSLGNNLFDGHCTICPVVSCSNSTFSVVLRQIGKHGIKWLLLGFENVRSLTCTTTLGVVEMSGAIRCDQALYGALAIYRDGCNDEFSGWRLSAEELLTRIRDVMSFAAARSLSVPIIEVISEGSLTLETFAQSLKPTTGLRPFAAINQVDIFQCAVDSFFNQAIEIKNLSFAVEWFSMRATYTDANLITAMTVLENLVDSNLSEDEVLILNEKVFEKFRKKLSKVVKTEVHDLFSTKEEQEQAVCNFSAKFQDLNRKTLVQKVHLLAHRWGVSLEGLNDADLSEAKRARDHIVHRGIYTAKKGSTRDLHDHLLITREIVSRLILTAIGFEGKYHSFIGGWHEKRLVSIPSR